MDSRKYFENLCQRVVAAINPPVQFSLGEVPLICQKANITSVLKANGKENVENRRFIFLL